MQKKKICQNCSGPSNLYCLCNAIFICENCRPEHFESDFVHDIISIEDYNALVCGQKFGFGENRKIKDSKKVVVGGEGELSLKILRTICKIIVESLEHSRSFEYNKQYLLMQGDFSLEIARKAMENSNEFTQNNLSVFLAQIGLEINQSAADSIFQKYFPNPHDISSVFFPIDPEYQKILNSATSPKFCKSTSKKLKKLFEEILTFETKIQKIHKKLSESLLTQVFQSIDQDNDGQITAQDLKTFFLKSGFNISNSDLSEILKSSHYLDYSKFLKLLHW